MLSIVPAVSGFAPGAPALAPAMAPAASVSMQERSASIPFLKKPPALDGSLPGDVGFDPLGFSTTITELGGDLNYVREAELMHGRQAMLAVVGFVFPAVFGKLPVAWTAGVSTNPLEAQYQLPPQIYAQVRHRSSSSSSSNHTPRERRGSRGTDAACDKRKPGRLHVCLTAAVS